MAMEREEFESAIAKKQSEVERARKVAFGLNDLNIRYEQEICELSDRVAQQQAKIDALMLEFCPGEMTEDQMSNWSAHQQPIY